MTRERAMIVLADKVPAATFVVEAWARQTAEAMAVLFGGVWVVRGTRESGFHVEQLANETKRQTTPTVWV